MNGRLQQFLTAENISQSTFADTLGVARASVSHILSGRNKPGFDFIEAMARHYPTLNLEWLVTGKGKMYKQMQNPPVREEETDNLLPLFDKEETIPEPPVQKTETKADNPLIIKNIHKQNRSISKIIVFFDDGTYQELK
ncbi:MAG: helix-turn-helix transcriptional regulator [Bacteroidales bacterium]|nr:helix-turn-helix transcriptional regulator [Bacteroidales bacterium]